MVLISWFVYALVPLFMMVGNVCDQEEPLPSIVRIVAQQCRPDNHERTLTGFVINDSAVSNTPAIVTALHGVANCGNIEAVSDSEVITDVISGLELRGVDLKHDVALLSMRDEQATLFASSVLTVTDDLPEIDANGERGRICTAGYPAGIIEQWSYSLLTLQNKPKTRLYRLFPPDADMLEDLRVRPSPSSLAQVLRIDGELAPGLSGAPILNEAGEVFGIVEGGLKEVDADTVSWAIHWANVNFEAVDDALLEGLAAHDPRLVFNLRSSVTATPMPSPTVTTTRTPTATSTPTSTSALREPPANSLFVIGEEFGDNIYLVGGEQVASYTPGDQLVVYDEVSQQEIAIALLTVIAKNPNSLTVQTILVHPRRIVRPQQRVDDALDHLSSSELVPAEAYAVGYLLREERIRLRPNSGLQRGDLLEALEFEIEDGVRLDALPFSPTIQMRVTSMGVSKEIARVVLVTGNWPEEGTIVRVVEKIIPTVTLIPTATPSPTPRQPATATSPPTATANPTPSECQTKVFSSIGSTSVPVYTLPERGAPVPNTAIDVGTKVNIIAKGAERHKVSWTINGVKRSAWISINNLDDPSHCVN